MAEVLAKSPAEQLEIAAALVQDARPEMVRLGWALARKAVMTQGAIEGLQMGREASAERGLERLRGHLGGGAS